VLSTIFQRHLGLKGSPCRSAHLGGRQASIGDWRRAERLTECKQRVLHAHDMTS
jgi:hypothetical protein